MSRRIVLSGDYHFGSTVGPFDVEVEGIDYKPTKVQRFINKKFWQMIDDVGHVDAVLSNGDIIEGYNRKSNGMGCITTDIMKQAHIAAEMLSYFNTRKHYGTNGSPYHTNQNPSGDEVVMRLLGGEFGDYQIIKVGNKRIHAIHKVGGSSYPNRRVSGLSTEIMLAMLNEPEWNKFDVITRAHRHYYASVEFKDRLGIITPCWKGLDEFAYKLGTGFVPELGYVLLEIDGNDINKYVSKFTLQGEDLYKEHIL
jgi:hypothetical protein